MKAAFFLAILQNGPKRIPMGLVLAVAVTFLHQDATAIPIDLGAASSFAVLAGSAITGSAGSIIAGDVGLSPTTGAAITALTSGQVIGTIYAVDAGYVGGAFVENATLLTQAKTALDTAYGLAAGATTTGTIAGNQLGGQTLIPGVYNFEVGTTVNLSGSGILTLNAQSNPNAVWIFQVPSDLVTASDSSVVFTDGVGSPCNVFWQVTSSATLGSGSVFEGNILALESITLNSARVYGRVLARNSAVTLNNSIITNDCTAGIDVPDTGSTLLLLGSGLVTLLAFRRRFFSPA